MKYLRQWHSDTPHHHPKCQIRAWRTNFPALVTAVVSKSRWQPTKIWGYMVHHQGQTLNLLLELIVLQAYHTFGLRHQHWTHTLCAKYQQISLSCCINWRGLEHWRKLRFVFDAALFTYNKYYGNEDSLRHRHIKKRENYLSTHNQERKPIFKPTSIDYNLPIDVPKEENMTGITTKKLPAPSAVVTKEEGGGYLPRTHNQSWYNITTN